MVSKIRCCCTVSWIQKKLQLIFLYQININQEKRISQTIAMIGKRRKTVMLLNKWTLEDILLKIRITKNYLLKTSEHRLDTLVTIHYRQMSPAVRKPKCQPFQVGSNPSYHRKQLTPEKSLWLEHSSYTKQTDVITSKELYLKKNIIFNIEIKKVSIQVRNNIVQANIKTFLCFEIFL